MHPAAYTVTLIFIFGTWSADSGPVISSNIREACPGEKIIFTCETRGSLTLRWMNDQTEYGVQIIFSTPDAVGTIRPSDVNPNITATLINNTVEDGERVLVSELHITASAEIPTATILCLDRINISNATFQILDIPEMPQRVTANQRINGTNGCTILVGWLPPANIAEDDVLHYLVYVNGTNIIYMENLTLTAYPVCTCASHTASVTAVDRCGRQGQRSPDITLNPEPLLNPDLQCDASTIQPSCPDNDSGAAVISLGVFLALLVIIATALFISTIILAIKCHKHKPPKKTKYFIRKN